MIRIQKGWGRSPWALIRNDIKVRYFPDRIKKRLGQLKEECKRKSTNRSLFTHVSIETISACNNNCSFCPVSTINNKRPVFIMDDLVFRKIVKQLKGVNFIGSLCPQINNEPLLDGKIFERIRYIKQTLRDNVRISVETNGTLLTVSKIYRVFEEGADRICINDYADRRREYLLFTRRIRRILQGLDVNRIKREVSLEINHRLKKQILSDRLGKVKGRKVGITDREKFCDFPFYQLNINSKGGIFICCRDSYWEGLLGNINTQNIKEIWYAEKYTKIRDAFLENRRILSTCQRCPSNGSATI